MTYLEKAKALMPVLYTKKVKPLAESEPEKVFMWKGRSFTLDFGTHLVGHFVLKVETSFEPDSPLQLQLEFAEMPFELDDYEYTGGLSSSWIQKEIVNIDNPLEEIVLPRRYAFRYVKITLTANTGYKTKYKEAYCVAMTSADQSKVEPLFLDDSRVIVGENAQLLEKIDKVSMKTLEDCMQLVFEDGPKRDRRLWLGDLYLQEKANFHTFRNYDLVKRCLYLFAGLAHPDGCLSSAVYHEPMLKNQAWIIHDYALYFIGILYDCYQYMEDIELVKELWGVAFRQTQIATEALTEDGIVKPENYFIDWCAELDKTAAAQGILVEMLKKARFLAEIVGSEEEKCFLDEQIIRTSEAAKTMFDEAQGLFVSGQSRQVSWQSQSHMILAQVFDKEKNARILDRLSQYDNPVKTVTPYARHYYVQAMIESGLEENAIQMILDYWGDMVKKGADCFWEVHIPGEPEASPYGSHRINSYCHAWSCTPTYFIRKYFSKED